MEANFIIVLSAIEVRAEVSPAGRVLISILLLKKSHYFKYTCLCA